MGPIRVPRPASIAAPGRSTGIRPGRPTLTGDGAISMNVARAAGCGHGVAASPRARGPRAPRPVDAGGVCGSSAPAPGPAISPTIRLRECGARRMEDRPSNLCCACRADRAARPQWLPGSRPGDRRRRPCEAGTGQGAPDGTAIPCPGSRPASQGVVAYLDAQTFTVDLPARLTLGTANEIARKRRDRRGDKVRLRRTGRPAGRSTSVHERAQTWPGDGDAAY
jgi:hypothetical protein